MMILPKHWGALTPVLAFGALIAGIQAGRPSWLQEPRPRSAAVIRVGLGAKPANPLPVTEPILGYLDMRDGKPSLFAQRNSKVQVSGWTACSVPGSSLSKVVVLVDGEQRAEVKEFFSRPDVAAAFGRPEFEMSGWRATLSLGGLKPGEHVVTAEGVGSRGEKGALPAFRLTILE